MATATSTTPPNNLRQALTTFVPYYNTRNCVSNFLETLEHYDYKDPCIIHFSSKSMIVKVNNTGLAEETILKIHNIAQECIERERTNTQNLHDRATAFIPNIIRTDREIAFITGTKDYGVKKYTEMEYVGTDLFNTFLNNPDNTMNIDQLSSFTAQFMAYWEILLNNNQFPTDIKPENITIKAHTKKNLKICFIDHEVVLESGQFDFKNTEVYKTTGFFPPSYAASKIDSTYLSFPLGIILFMLIAKQDLFGVENIKKNLQLSVERSQLLDRLYLYKVFQLLGQPDKTFFDGGKQIKPFPFKIEKGCYKIQLNPEELECIDQNYFIKNEEELKNKLHSVLENESHPLHEDNGVEEKAIAFKDIIMNFLKAKANTSPRTLLPQLEKIFPNIRTSFEGHLSEN